MSITVVALPELGCPRCPFSAVSLRAAARRSQTVFCGNAPNLPPIRKLQSLRNPYAIESESKSKLNAARRYKAAGKEAVMLDLTFVTLGCAVIGLMIVYAVALRQL